MSSKPVAISVRDLGKSYVIARRSADATTLAEALLRKLRRPLASGDMETFWALRGIEFDIAEGDVVGIVGRNGAGKSTLLKILSRITRPTTGRIELFGRVGSLLEVGTGFHPELTGRENIFLNGAILGMTRREIQRQFDAIVDFSGIEQFLEVPVKRYSSGMYVRLAFAVAAHLQSEILIVDEVLAVGDADFQKKCLGKMKDVAGQGRTVLFVSHDMAAVRHLCRSALMLEKGRVEFQGTSEEVLKHYMAARENIVFEPAAGKYGLVLNALEFVDADGGHTSDCLLFGRDYLLRLGISAPERFSNFAIDLRILDDTGTRVASICTIEEGMKPFVVEGDTQVVLSLPQLSLFPGKYHISLYLFQPNEEVLLERHDIASFEVEPAVVDDALWAYQRVHGVARIARGGSVIYRSPRTLSETSGGVAQG